MWLTNSPFVSPALSKLSSISLQNDEISKNSLQINQVGRVDVPVIVIPYSVEAGEATQDVLGGPVYVPQITRE